MHDLDIVIPVYNEGQNIVDVLDALGRSVQTPFRILICYDEDSDDTLPAVRQYGRATFDIQLVKNRGTGVLQAILSGFQACACPLFICSLAGRCSWWLRSWGAHGRSLSSASCPAVVGRFTFRDGVTSHRAIKP